MTFYPETSNNQYDNNPKGHFELLSAYLDGEVTAAERQQVDYWLATEPKVQRLYRRLLQLHHGINSLPIPQAERPSPESISRRVIRRVQKRRLRKIVVLGGGAIAAGVVATIGGLLTQPNTRIPQIAQSPSKTIVSEVNSEPLMIAVNQPLVEIPQAAGAKPD